MALVLFRLITPFSLYNPTYRRSLVSFIKALHTLNIRKFNRLFNKFLNVKVLRGTSLRLLFLCSVYVKLIKSYNSTTYKLDFVQRFFFLLYTFLSAGSFNRLMGTFLEFIFGILTKFNNISVHFFLVSNDSITASFLSRFIAKKLNQNLSLKEVLNPLKREFYKV